MRFHAGEQFLEAYHDQVFIAEHGTRNRDEEIGCAVMLFRPDDERRPIACEPFGTDWFQEQ